MEYGLQMAIRSQLTSLIWAPLQIKKGKIVSVFLEWEGGELYNIAVLVSLDVQMEGVGQPECFRGTSKEPPGHLEKEDIPSSKSNC